MWHSASLATSAATLSQGLLAEWCRRRLLLLNSAGRASQEPPTRVVRETHSDLVSLRRARYCLSALLPSAPCCNRASLSRCCHLFFHRLSRAPFSLHWFCGGIMVIRRPAQR